MISKKFSRLLTMLLVIALLGWWLVPDPEECFTDMCVGCVDDCLAPAAK